jgi:hypothetical protein
MDIYMMKSDFRLCGARTRAGLPCRRRRLPGRPRCIGHGGHWRSGKQTPEGRQRIGEAKKRYWERWRLAKALKDSAGG